MRIVSNIRVICTSGLFELEIYRTTKVQGLDSTKIANMDWKSRKDAGFSRLFIDNILHFVEIYRPNQPKELLALIRGVTPRASIVLTSVKVTPEMWNTDIPRLVYNSIRESAYNCSPDEILLKKDSRRIYFPEMVFDDDAFIHGLQLSMLKVDDSGLAISADYISTSREGVSTNTRASRLGPGERWERTEILLEHLIPAGGLPLFIGGNEFVISSKSVVLDLEE